MKRILFASAIAFLLISTISGCRKDVYGCTDPNATNYNSSANISNGTCTYTGDFTFWYPGNLTNANVTIYDASGSTIVATGTVTQYYPNGLPTCGSVGCANFTLPVGTYVFAASNTDNPPKTWNGYATAASGHCNLYQLQ